MYVCMYFKQQKHLNERDLINVLGGLQSLVIQKHILRIQDKVLEIGAYFISLVTF